MFDSPGGVLSSVLSPLHLRKLGGGILLEQVAIGCNDS